MNNQYRPKLPLPASLKGTDENSFARFTVLERMPRIARRVLSENQYSPETIAKIESLIGELESGSVKPLGGSAAPDIVEWNRHLSQFPNHSWLEIPWFFAETYFYRRIVEASNYFENGSDQYQDPYALQKSLALQGTMETTRTLSTKLKEWNNAGWNRDIFGSLLSIALWGNQVDLSMWPAGEAGQPEHANIDQQQAHVLADDTAHITNLLDNAAAGARIDFIVDNAGFELVCDLFLSDYLLSSEQAREVRLNLKIHPTFVSDAMISDVIETIDGFAGDESPDVRAFASRLRKHLDNGCLRLEDHPFWTSPLDAWHMPPGLRRDLAPSQLVISKGDANYRRLLGDRHWPFTTPFADIVSYFPCPLVALRTIKSEVLVGLESARLDDLGPDLRSWMTTGQWGLIQYAPLT